MSKPKFTAKSIKNNELWENFIKKNSPAVFLQSWEWGEFQKKNDRKVWRVGVFEKNPEGESILHTATMAYILEAKFHKYLYTSNGPIFTSNTPKEALEKLRNKLEDIAKANDCTHIRIDPVISETEENLSKLKNLKFHPAPKNIQAKHRWIIDITKDKETLLSDMRKNTRYSIRRSAKENVETEYTTEKESFKDFWPLFQETVEKHGFNTHPKSYFEKLFKHFDKEGSLRFYFTKQGEEILANAIVAFYGDTAYYLHAASTRKIKNTFPSYNLIWKVIQDAKQKEIRYFDMWGVAPTDNPNHPDHGYSFFKKGFGGFRQDLIDAHDFPVSNKYKLISTAEGIKNRMKKA